MVLENFIVDAPIVWDRVGKKIFENPHVKQGRKMRVQITNAGMVEDLSGYTLALAWRHTVSGVEGFDVFEDSSEANVGIFEMTYTENLMTNLGNLNVSLVLTSSEDMFIAESNDFYVKVDGSPIGIATERGVGSYTRLAQILFNEEIRQEAYLKNEAVVASIDDKFDAFIQSNIVQEEVAEVFNNLEETYARDLLSVKQQLEQTNVRSAEAIAKANTIASGSPKGVYATLALLQAAYPTGTTGAYLVTADGKWYYWSGSAWSIGAVYQATGIADGSVTIASLDAELRPKAEALVNNNGSGKLFVIADGDNNAVLSVTNDGDLILLDNDGVQSQLDNLNKSVDNTQGTEAVFAIIDDYDNAVLSVDKKLELQLPNMNRTVQESAVSDYIFNAIRYANLGDNAMANYWYDRAANEFKTPLMLRADVAADGLDNSLQRIPCVEKIAEGRLLYMWCQILKPVDSDGEGGRIVYCFIDYDLEDGTISVGEKHILEEPSLWSSGLGMAGHNCLVKLPSGRILCLFNYNDNPDGIAGNRILNIYMKYSDDGGMNWSDKARIHEAPGTAIPRIASLGTCGSLVRIHSGTHEGRIISTVWTGLNSIYSLYSDDNGVTWTAGQKVAITGFTDCNENAVACREDGTLIMTIRSETKYKEIYATSADGGETWTFHGAKENWIASNCNRSMIQASTSPVDGFPKILWSGLNNALMYKRKNLVLRVSHDGGVSYKTQYKPVHDDTPAGYSDIKMISKDTIAVAWESGFNTNCSTKIYITNMAEVYKNGANL